VGFFRDLLSQDVHLEWLQENVLSEMSIEEDMNSPLSPILNCLRCILLGRYLRKLPSVYQRVPSKVPRYTE